MTDDSPRARVADDAEEVTLSRAELDELVEAKVDERLAEAQERDGGPEVSRRGMLGALGLGVAGSGLVGGSKDRSSNQAALDTGGVQSDFSVPDLTADTVTTDVLNAKEFDGVRYASEFSGANGGEMIQNAIDDVADNLPHGGAVVVSPNGPDTFAPSSTYSKIEDTWNVANPPIKFDDDTTVIMRGGSTIAVSAEDTETYIFEPKDSSSGQSGFSIIGENPETCLIHGNAANQTETSGTSAGGVNVSNCNNVNILNIGIGPTNGHAIVKRGTSRLIVNNIRFNQDGSRTNQDGITGGNSDRLLISNCYGQVGDDFLGMGNGTQFVHITNCDVVDTGGGYEFINIPASSSNPTEHIYVTNSRWQGGGGSNFCELEGDTGNPDDRRYIGFQNCGFSGVAKFLSVPGSAAGVTLSNIQGTGFRKIYAQTGGTVRGLRIDGVDFFQQENNSAGVFQISGGTLRNARVTNWQSRYDGAQGGTSERLININSGGGSVTIERTVFANIFGEQHGTYIDINDSGGSGVTLRDVTFDTIQGTPNPNENRGAVFRRSGVRYDNVRLRNLSLPEYSLESSNLYWNGIRGGGPVGGVDLSTVSGNVAGEMAYSDGSVNNFPLGTVASWDPAAGEWVRLDGQETV